ncbi:MAG: zinc ribbon domain-containing protein [Deltaproteobacteria bacterium]|nr:MAG: zinc ribbon domain-containing protein [Deltaproteobacteria bacterium]
MPTYEFKCQKCRKNFSLMLTLREYETKKIRCPKCKSTRVTQQITAFETITSKKS